MSEATTPITPVSDGRAPDGRFLPGNRASKGNPINRKICALKAAALEAVTVGDMKEIIGAMVGEAKKGDVAAARLVCEYAIGKPVNQVALTDADGGPMALAWSQVEARILGALESAPDGLRFGVALALRGLANDVGDAEPDRDGA